MLCHETLAQPQAPKYWRFRVRDVSGKARARLFMAIELSELEDARERRLPYGIQVSLKDFSELQDLVTTLNWRDMILGRQTAVTCGII